MSRRSIIIWACLGVLVTGLLFWYFAVKKSPPQVRAKPLEKNIHLPAVQRTQPVPLPTAVEPAKDRADQFIQKAKTNLEEAMAELMYYFDELGVEEIDEVGRFLQSKGRWEQAVEVWRKGLEREPGRSDWKRNLAVALIRAGETTAASQATEEILSSEEMDPDQAFQSYQLLASQWLEGGHPEEAVRLMEQAVQRFPGELRYPTELGLAYLENGQGDQAREMFQKRLNENPNDPDAHFGLGVVARVGGNTDEALASLNRALQLDPHHPDAQFNMAEILTFERGEQGTVAEKYLAERYYSDLTQRFPENPDLQNGLAAVSLASGRAAEAIAIWERMSRGMPEESIVQSNLSEAYLSAKRPLDAIQAARRAMQIDPANSDAYFQLGNAELAAGNPRAGIEAIRKAVELDPADMTYQKRLRELGVEDATFPGTGGS